MLLNQYPLKLKLIKCDALKFLTNFYSSDQFGNKTEPISDLFELIYVKFNCFEKKNENLAV